MTEITPRAQTSTMQAFANRVVRGMLRTPLVARGIGRKLVTIYVVGRKSGRRYSIPVAYERGGDRLLVGSPFPWVRNLRTGESVDIRLQGRRRQADVEVLSEEADVVPLYAEMCRKNRIFANFNKISIDDSGEPSSDDLRAAWVAGARAIWLSPR